MSLFTERDCPACEKLRRDNERLLLKANSLSDNLYEAETELAEAKRILREVRGKLSNFQAIYAANFADSGANIDNFLTARVTEQ